MIRKYKEDDITEVLDVWLRASIQAHDFIDADFWESGIQDMENIYMPSSEVFVFKEKGIIAGFYAMHENMLAALFVKPEIQGRGIGSELLLHAKKNHSIIELTVYQKNKSAISFYEKHGFKEIKKQTCEHTAEPEILMRWCS